jgi:GT2 family glycosyltransferase
MTFPPLTESVSQPGLKRQADRPDRSPATPPGGVAGTRAHVRGKFLFAGTEKLYVRGVTYGTFAPNREGDAFPEREVVQRDFDQMAATGVNAVRTYTVPPRWLLDAAQQCGLRVMVGLPWEQHVAFLDDTVRSGDIVDRVRAGVHACAGHPAVLCYAIGNEIPTSIVRWYGAGRVERFLERVYRAAKADDRDALVTYVNYPPTEYLHLDFVDFLCCNVYLESQERLAAYLARLQNIAGERPLVLAEIGLDSRRHGDDVQARTLDWQLRTAFATGCAGAFVFSWTDEWQRGGYAVEDWDFGLTTRDRRLKPALAAVRGAFAEAPFAPDIPWPRVSVVVCSFNGARVIRDCLDGIQQLTYPDYEVIVVDDGSTDATASIAQEYGVRLIRTKNHGLSSARNTGLEAATGEIVAYTDDDARPDPHWLTYLATSFRDTEYVGVGGPNIAPPGDGPIAECVANAPGGPMHVLLSDVEAEHLPGCNMAFRKVCLQAVGGFDPQFRAAGDDVDICWRLRQRGWKLGFHPAAMVWHHRRDSARAYWKQQVGYGKAEALLARKWPEKYNGLGHLTWSGRLYGRGLTEALGFRRRRIVYGVWGTELFQCMYQPAPGVLGSLPLMPEWYLLIGVLALLSALSPLWAPLLIALPFVGIAAAASLLQAALSAARGAFPSTPPSRTTRLKRRVLTTFLHLLQPLARLHGRLWHGLNPWRHEASADRALPRVRTWTIWSEHWRAPEEWLRSAEAALVAHGIRVRRGGALDRWDLQVRVGILGMARVLMVAEEHGAGHQLLRFQVKPVLLPRALAVGLLAGALSGRAQPVQHTEDSADGGPGVVEHALSSH